MTMLSEGHPHAWDVNFAEQHLPTRFVDTKLPENGRLVVTPQMRLLAQGLPSALERGAPIVLEGPFGAGKSTTLAAVAAVSDVKTVIVELMAGGSRKEHWKVIANAVTGQTHEGTALQLHEIACDALVAVPTLLIVDEAQELDTAALKQLRYLCDRKFHNFAVILAGSGLETKLAKAPAIDSRIARRVRLPRPTRDTMLEQIRKYHPQLAATDIGLLEQVDAVFAKGSWRQWSEFTLHLVNDFKWTGPLTAEQVNHIVYTITGSPADIVPKGAR